MLFACDRRPQVRVGLFCRRSVSPEHHCEVLRELLIRGRAMIREPFDIIGRPVTVAGAMRVRDSVKVSAIHSLRPLASMVSFAFSTETLT